MDRPRDPWSGRPLEVLVDPPRPPKFRLRARRDGRNPGAVVSRIRWIEGGTMHTRWSFRRPRR